MLNVSLIKLLDMLRVEVGDSLNPAHGSQMRDRYVMLLQRQQEMLWEEYRWPHLRVWRTFPLQNGQRYYTVPADIPLERVERMEVRWGQRWRELYPEITLRDHLVFDSDLDQRSWPIQKWRVHEGHTVEFWPIPAQDADPDVDSYGNAVGEGAIKVWGIRKLAPLVADTDTADLDSQIIVLMAAAEELLKTNEKLASLKNKKAQDRLNKLIGNLTPKHTFKIGERQVAHKTWLRGPARVHYRDREVSKS